MEKKNYSSSELKFIISIDGYETYNKYFNDSAYTSQLNYIKRNLGPPMMYLKFQDKTANVILCISF